jgi:hypothetical protein
MAPQKAGFVPVTLQDWTGDWASAAVDAAAISAMSPPQANLLCDGRSVNALVGDANALR